MPLLVAVEQFGYSDHQCLVATVADALHLSSRFCCCLVGWVVVVAAAVLCVCVRVCVCVCCHVFGLVCYCCCCCWCFAVPDAIVVGGC